MVETWHKITNFKQQNEPKNETLEIYQKRFTSSRFVIRNLNAHGSAGHYCL
jgi:hypothetical protein